MFVDRSLRERIHEANVSLHRSEAEYYELLHPEIYGEPEQERINSALKILDRLVTDNQRKALDFGAGTGNITGKLLHMGYNVTAVDISAEMCKILEGKYKSYSEAGKLRVINSPIETANFDKGKFDSATCYSVLHHLPDYLGTIERLSFFLKKGGVMYLDHEASPFYWKPEPNNIAYLLKQIYFHSNQFLNYSYLRIRGINLPSPDYVLSDYWHKREHPIDHEKIKYLFKKENFRFFTRQDYYIQQRTWIPNPTFYPYRYACKPEMSLWIAKK